VIAVVLAGALALGVIGGERLEALMSRWFTDD
jgi:hypothetical protein